MAKYSSSARQGREERDAPAQEGNPEERQGGKGGTVKSRKQAIAIGLSEARQKGKKVPKRRRKSG